MLSLMAAKKVDSWKIEALAQKAFERTKQRFWSYLFVYVIGIGIGLLAAIGLLIIGLILFLLFKAVNLPALTIVLGVVLGLGFFAALIYLGSWIQLATLSVITDEKKVSVNESLKKTRTIVPGFVLLNVLSGLFIFGLLPFGVPSLFVIFILWAVWGSLIGFVYLYQKQPQGIKSLWLSRQMVGQNFWGIVGRLLLMGGVIYLIIFLFALSKNSLLSSLSPIVSLVSTPFIIAFLYEIYKKLAVPKASVAPKVWITLSVIGWILMIVILLTVSTFIFSILGKIR